MNSLAVLMRSFLKHRIGLLAILFLLIFNLSSVAQLVTQSNFTGVIVPQFMGSGNTTRIPIVYRATVSGLSPNTTYRYFNLACASTDFGTTSPGAGTSMLINAVSGTYTYATSPTLTVINTYETFTSDAAGSYTGWFCFLNTGNARFTAGNLVYPTIVIGNTSGTTLFRYALNESIKVLAYAASAGSNNGTGILSVSSATPKNFVALYDNVLGSGRPLSQTYVESEGIIVASVVPFYTTSVDGVAGAWGTIIPNDNVNGVRYIAQRAIGNGQLTGCAVSPNGIWPTGPVNTVNPTGGTTPLVIANSDAPLNSCNSISTDPITTLDYCLVSGVDIPVTVSYQATGIYFAGNNFTAQLSDASGIFTAPTSVGTINSISLTGNISCLIPSATPAGNGYRIRVVSDLPAFEGADNGANISLQIVQATASNTGPICAGQSISFSASGGVSYSWSGPNGFTSLLQNPSIPVTVSADSGLYSVLVTNANGCTNIATTNAVISNCGCVPPQTVPTITNVSCSGGADGSVSLSVIGGIPPYTFVWSNGMLTQNVSGLVAGNYSVIVSDGVNCNDTVELSITQPALLTLNLTSTNPNCLGAATGTITSVVAGGTTPYNYQGGNQTITGLAAGTYTITATDANGCSANASTTLTDPPAFSVSVASITNVTCNGGSNGAVDILVSNDTLVNLTNPGLLISEYFANPSGIDSSYEWVELLATMNINFAITPYTVIVANNGIGTTKGWVQGGLSSATTNSTYAFQISTGTVNPGDVIYVGGSKMIVNGIKARVINTSISGGDGGIGSPNPTGVFGNGTGNADAIAVFDLPVASLDSNSVPRDAVFYGTAMGTAVVNGGIDGFTLPVNDRYNGGRLQTTSFLSPDPGANYGKATGSYNFKNGSYTTPRVWSLTTTFNDGLSNIQLVDQNTYLWSNGFIKEDLINVVSGSYTVTVTSPVGCTATTAAFISEPLPIQISSIVANVQCFSGNNGSINLTVSGGIEPYTYLWNDESTSEDRSTLIAGNYTVTISSANGCTVSTTLTVTEPSELLIGTNPQNTSCYGFSNGSIDLSVLGGTPGYTYEWSNGDLTEDIFNQPAGIYFVTVTDAAGCQNSTLDFINDADPIIISGFSPLSGSPGTTVIINGSGFTDATALDFNGLAAIFTVLNDGQISAVVPVGAASGVITVNTAPTCSTTSFQSFTVINSALLNLTAIIEGYYDTGSGQMTTTLINQGIVTGATECDTLTVELHDQFSPATIVGTVNTILHTNGQAAAVFPGALSGGSYYIVLKHRNAIQTWSALPVSISAVTNYNFTTSATQAYGANQKLVGSVWTIFSGDINPQDEFIDASDMALIDNDASAFAFGYFDTDVNGDGFVDASDMAYVDNNATLFIFSAHP